MIGCGFVGSIPYELGNLQNLTLIIMFDATLLAYPNTFKTVNQSAGPNLNSWNHKLVAAMVKMGNINGLTGSQGEIRVTCRHTNNSFRLKLKFRFSELQNHLNMYFMNG